MMKWPASLFGLAMAAFTLTAHAAPDSAAALAIVKKNSCAGCHAVNSQVVGPAYREIAKKYQNDPTAPDKLFTKVRNGGAFVWGEIPMPPNPNISDADLHTVIAWILAGAPDH
jgi:cytochrome c